MQHTNTWFWHQRQTRVGAFESKTAKPENLLLAIQYACPSNPDLQTLDPEQVLIDAFRQELETQPPKHNPKA